MFALGLGADLEGDVAPVGVDDPEAADGAVVRPDLGVDLHEAAVLAHTALVLHTRRETRGWNTKHEFEGQQF